VQFTKKQGDIKREYMELLLVMIGKTDKPYVDEGVKEYFRKLKHYIKFCTEIIPGLKNAAALSPIQQNQKEGEAILSKLRNDDYTVLLDEIGKQYTSVEWAGFLQKKFNSNPRRLVFIIGGPYGFSEAVYKRANEKISLSKMTFSHQMVRLFFVEQLYRAMTILKGEPYHH
jgi:23S rRNA (pseudouridine1915-N3)-methyltransferase